MIWGRGNELWTELGEWKMSGTVGTEWRRNPRMARSCERARKREGKKMPVFQIWGETLFSFPD